MKPLRDVSEYLTRVREIHEMKNWFVGDQQWGPWFRGQRDASWNLTPKLYRDRGFKEVKADDVEDEIREEFIKRAPIMCESLPNGTERREEWEWYFMMQHFGAATRLLDWTEGALIALYFAIKTHDGKGPDAAVWVLDPYRLNKSVIGKEWVIPPSAPGIGTAGCVAKVEKWLPARFTKLAGLPREPVAVEPMHVARRISSQHSCFTIHGTDKHAFDKLQRKKDGCLIKIAIQASGINAIKRELRIYGINETTIFPDLDGLGRSINSRWEIKEH
jgi:hypothetical protein